MGRKKRNESPIEQHLKAVANHYIQRMQQGENITLLSILEELLNALMIAERDLYLSFASDNQANGFYDRGLKLTMGNLNLKVPRVRFGNSFRPSLLPERWKRVDKDYENLLLAILANGYSRARTKNTLEELNLPYSEESVEELVNLIYDHLQFYKEAPLDEEMFAVFIDAYHAKLRDENGRVTDVTIFVGIGINMEGYKTILGWWVKVGRESKAFWTEVLQDLISRGLSRVGIFVTDDFSGLRKLLPKFYPQSDHQLCLVHLIRNLRKEFGREYRGMRRMIRKVLESETREEAEGYWDRLIEVVRAINLRRAKELEGKRDNYLAFTMYPEEACIYDGHSGEREFRA